MKKLLSLLIPMLAVCLFSFAQAPTHKFSVQLVDPADNSSIANGSNVNQFFIVTIDQGSLGAGDSVGYIDPFTGQGLISIQWNFGVRNQGDTFHVKRAYTGISAPAGPFNYCVIAQVWNRSANYVVDSNTAPDCHSVTITGFPSGVQNMFSKENLISQKISIYPNPATGDNINLDYIAQNTSEVEVNVYDLTGRKIMSKSFGKAFKGQEGYGLDISAINKGMYILELRQDGIKATGQFVK